MRDKEGIEESKIDKSHSNDFLSRQRIRIKIGKSKKKKKNKERTPEQEEIRRERRKRIREKKQGLSRFPKSYRIQPRYIELVDKLTVEKLDFILKLMEIGFHSIEGVIINYCIENIEYILENRTERVKEISVTDRIIGQILGCTKQLVVTATLRALHNRLIKFIFMKSTEVVEFYIKKKVGSQIVKVPRRRTMINKESDLIIVVELDNVEKNIRENIIKKAGEIKEHRRLKVRDHSIKFTIRRRRRALMSKLLGLLEFRIKQLQNLYN